MLNCSTDLHADLPLHLSPDHSAVHYEHGKATGKHSNDQEHVEIPAARCWCHVFLNTSWLLLHRQLGTHVCLHLGFVPQLDHLSVHSKCGIFVDMRIHVFVRIDFVVQTVLTFNCCVVHFLVDADHAGHIDSESNADSFRTHIDILISNVLVETCGLDAVYILHVFVLVSLENLLLP